MLKINHFKKNISILESQNKFLKAFEKRFMRRGHGISETTGLRGPMRAISLVIFGLISAGFFSSSAMALERPRSLATDSRIEVVNYEKNNVVPIYGSTFISTQIILGSNEKVVDVQGGDAAAWTISINQSLGNIINIKPTIVDSHSDLSVVSMDDQNHRRYYRFELISQALNAKAQNETYAIQFVYPEDEKAKLIAKLNYSKLEKKSILSAYKNPEFYNWNYSFHGSHSILPLHVFDDGKFTYLQLRQNQALPAIFAVNNRAGEESVVNYRRVGDYLVIQEVAPQFTLRDGKYAVASIFNDQVISHIQ